MRCLLSFPCPEIGLPARNSPKATFILPMDKRFSIRAAFILLLCVLPHPSIHRALAYN